MIGDIPFHIHRPTMKSISRIMFPLVLPILIPGMLQGRIVSSPMNQDDSYSECQGNDRRLFADCYRRLSVDSCLKLWRSDPYGCNARRTLGLMVRLREDLKLDSLPLDSVIHMLGQPNELYHDDRSCDSPPYDGRSIRAVYYMQGRCVGGAPDYRETMHLRMTLYFDPRMSRGDADPVTD